jgi:hypothetical protein
MRTGELVGFTLALFGGLCSHPGPPTIVRRALLRLRAAGGLRGQAIAVQAMGVEVGTYAKGKLG